MMLAAFRIRPEETSRMVHLINMPVRPAHGGLRHRAALAGIAAFSLLASTGAHAQSFPVKPVRIISPFEAGGSNDGVIRPVGPRMGELLGQQVLVENRPGAGGVVGSEVVARANPDGYTLLVGTTSTHAINPALRKLPYWGANALEMAKLFLMAPIRSDAFQPAIR
jgi:tripartite-type tricarboxylate transporter receptor subunit TctC